MRAVDRLATGVGAGRAADVGDPSLSTGAAGLSMLFAQLALSRDGKTAAALAAQYLDRAVEVLASAPLGPSLYGGFTGVAWAAHLVGQLLDPDGEDRNEEIDDALLGLLTTSNWEQAPYDLIQGLTGIGFYALERWPRPAARECVGHVVRHLSKQARHDKFGAYWWTAPSLLLGSRRQHYPDGLVDLGVAHGIAGVVPLLARLSALGAADSPARELLDGAVRWLLAHAVQSEAGPTMPYFVAGGASADPARSAWCYGDPGVAATLLVAAREVEEPAWEQAATELAIRATQRSPELSGVTDACFCHGSAGLAHLFNRMYQMTGETKLRDVALFWLDRTLEMCARALTDTSPAMGEEGKALPWNGPGLLEGAAGVGLVLLAAGTAAEPTWDRMFLVSRLAPNALGTRP